MANAAGAVISLALIGGIGVWSYQLIMRDVSGIPVVRAAAGEMRVRPEDPGGMQARHQGLAVNAVAADGGAEKPADRLVLAPRAASLTEDDQPVSAEMVAPVQQPEALPPAEEMAAAADPDALIEAMKSGSVEDIVAQLTDGVEPIAAPGALPEAAPEEASDTAADDAGDDGTEAAILAAIAGVEAEASKAPAVTGPGVRASMRPRLRPAGGPEVVVAASYAAPAASAEIAAAEIPSGTRLAQLGAYDSADVARSEWARLQDRFGDYLQGKSRVVEKAQSGGRTFYRLRAMGFADLSDARRFCSMLVAERADCIPVVAR